MSKEIQIKHCENCQRVYVGTPEGRTALLCQKCSLDCDNAFFKIHRILRRIEAGGLQAQSTDISWLAHECNIPEIFVMTLFNEGVFTKRGPSAVATNGGQTPLNGGKNTCQQCKCEIEPGKRRFCESCSVVMSKQLRSSFTDVLESIEDEEKKLKNRGHRYGLRNH